MGVAGPALLQRGDGTAAALARLLRGGSVAVHPVIVLLLLLLLSDSLLQTGPMSGGLGLFSLTHPPPLSSQLIGLIGRTPYLPRSLTLCQYFLGSKPDTQQPASWPPTHSRHPTPRIPASNPACRNALQPPAACLHSGHRRHSVTSTEQPLGTRSLCITSTGRVTRPDGPRTPVSPSPPSRSPTHATGGVRSPAR